MHPPAPPPRTRAPAPTSLRHAPLHPQVLKRINAEIEGRRAAGEQLPPPPKTAIAGPEYFGLNQPDICASIEALDPERLCAVYWCVRGGEGWGKVE